MLVLISPEAEVSSSSEDEQAVKDTIENKAKRIAIKEKCNFFISCARYADS